MLNDTHREKKTILLKYNLLNVFNLLKNISKQDCLFSKKNMKGIFPFILFYKISVVFMKFFLPFEEFVKKNISLSFLFIHRRQAWEFLVVKVLFYH